MRLRCSRSAALLLAIGFAAAAGNLEAQQPVPGGAIRQGVLSFDARATVGDFTGATQTIAGEMTGGASLAEVRGWVEAPVNTLVTGNGKRDKDLNRSMESEKYPTIRFDLTGVTLGEARGDTVAVTLDGKFQIHGVSQEASIPATVVLLADAIQVRGELPMNLKRYGIGGLSKMAGMLKMHEEIVVHLDLTFESSTVPGHPVAGVVGEKSTPPAVQ
jgi:polyisoprenoid-binding protein YceI